MFLIPYAKIHIPYKWLVTITVTLGMFMSLLDSTIVNVAIPQMQRAFGADIHDVQWVVTIYMLTQAAVIPIAPYLSAKFGSKRAYVWTLSAFLLGSLLCGFAWNLPSLLLFRLHPGHRGWHSVANGDDPAVSGLFPAGARHCYKRDGGAIDDRTSARPGGWWLPGYHFRLAMGLLYQCTTGYRRSVHRPAGTDADAATTPNTFRWRWLPHGCLGERRPGVCGLGGEQWQRYGWECLTLLGAVLLLLAFVMIELRQTRHGQEPLLDVRHFKDRTFAFSLLALVFYSFVWFGLLFLIPIYLQTLHQETALLAGMIQGTLALATMAILPFAGRLSDRIGPRLIAIVGLTILAGTTAFMVTLALNTAIWIIVGIMLLLGCSSGLTQQIPVSAMSHIKKEDAKAVAYGSTLVTVLRALAAPLGVATISSFVQVQSQQHTSSLAAQGFTGKLLQQQSTLLAMHQSFLVVALLALAAVAAMCFVPKRIKGGKDQKVQLEDIPMVAESIP